MGLIDLLFAILTASVFVLCNTGTKISLDPGREWVMYPVYFGAAFAFWLFRKVCIEHGLAVSSGVVDSLITLVSIAIGIFFFHESLHTRQYVGLGVLLVGLYLVR